MQQAPNSLTAFANPAAVQQQLQSLRELWKSVADDPSVERVHKLRTTTRRAEAAFAALGLHRKKSVRQLVRILKPVRRAAGEVRDLDVLSAIAASLEAEFHGEPLAKLSTYLTQERTKKSRKLQRLVEKHRARVRQELKKQQKHLARSPGSAFPPESSKQKGTLNAAEGRLFAVLQSWPELDAGTLHAFRIQVKKLRYMLQLSAETDAGMVDALNKTKDAIGDWHDYLELVNIAGRANAGAGSLLHYLQAMEQQKLQHALASANELRRYFPQCGPKKMPERALPQATIARLGTAQIP